LKTRQLNITDVFFDLDHTLWDFEKNSALAFQLIFDKNRIKLSIDSFLKYYVPANLKYWEMYRKDEIDHHTMRYRRLKDTFDFLDYKIDDNKIQLVSEEYIHYLPKNNYLIEGAFEVLEYLKPKYNLHIITNGFADIQKNKLDNSNISSYFKTITNSDLSGVKKPNPAIFEYALNLANTKKEDSIMIGDCIEADVQGALDAGLDAIYFNQNNQKNNSNIKQIENLLELKNHL
jgi:YjjG family noncanonical pyrimidine nucleotidase